MRLKSLDVFRGLTVAVMIFVNVYGLADLGAGGLFGGWIDHADWHNSWNLADFVFPFFLYIIGMAMAFSFAKYTPDNRPTAAVYFRILRRALLLFLIGLLINGLVYSVCKIPVDGIFNASGVRIMGVLQRISLAYAAASLIVLWLPLRLQWAVAGMILLSYGLVMTLMVAPDAPADVFSQTVDVKSFFDSKMHNIGAYIDRQLIPAAHFYAKGKKGYEAEGLFATIPAIVSVLLGYFTGAWLKQQREATTSNSINMAMFGLAAIVIGRIWSNFLPINKTLWTSSFVLFMAGWALVIFAACYELIDVRQIGWKWFQPLEIMGLNAITAFVGSVFMIKIIYFNNVNGCGDQAMTIYDFLRKNVFAWFGDANSALFLSLLSVLIWMMICYGLYWRRWFIKL
jgi:predicted acyltransferase